jgi:hypothetical protein
VDIYKYPQLVVLMAEIMLALQPLEQLEMNFDWPMNVDPLVESSLLLII